MTKPELRASYQRQIDTYRDELLILGRMLDSAEDNIDVEAATMMVKDLRVRARKLCDELGIYTDGTESMNTLVHRILEKIA